MNSSISITEQTGIDRGQQVSFLDIHKGNETFLTVHVKGKNPETVKKIVDQIRKIKWD